MGKIECTKIVKLQSISSNRTFPPNHEKLAKQGSTVGKRGLVIDLKLSVLPTIRYAPQLIIDQGDAKFQSGVPADSGNDGK